MPVTIKLSPATVMALEGLAARMGRPATRSSVACGLIEAGLGKGPSVRPSGNGPSVPAEQGASDDAGTAPSRVPDPPAPDNREAWIERRAKQLHGGRGMTMRAGRAEATAEYEQLYG